MHPVQIEESNLTTSKILKHKHLLVRAEIRRKMFETDKVNEWMRDFIEKIGMNLLIGPYSAYEDTPGNRGITTVVALTTSHAALHIWDEVDPGLLEFDLYSCKEFDLDLVLREIDLFFDVVRMEYMFLDREHNLHIISKS